MFKKIKKRLQTIRIKLGHFLLDKKPKGDWEPKKLCNSKMLFVRHDGKYGDLIVTSFIYREIKKQYPTIKIGVIAVKETADYFENNPHIDEVYIVKKRALLPFLCLGLKIKKAQYDIVFDLTDFLRNRDLLLLRVINAPVNIGYNKNHLRLFNINIESNSDLILTDYIQSLTYLGFDKNSINSHYELPQFKSPIELNHYIESNLNTPYIAINFFGAANSKKINRENQLNLLFLLKEKYPNHQLLILSYPAVTDKLKEYLPDFCLMYEKTSSINDTIKLIENSDLVVTPDTAIIHIAAAMNKPVIGFYNERNPSNPNKKWFPSHYRNQNVQIFYYQDNINCFDFSSTNYQNH